MSTVPEEPEDHKHYRLISKARKEKGLVRVASSSDGIVDVAAAVHEGLLADEGIVRLLRDGVRRRAAKLLQANEVVLVKPKAKTLRGNHITSQIRRLMDKALPTVIGPMYVEAKTKAGVSLARAMNRSMVVRWVMGEIENGGSELNKRLTRAGYGELCGLKRSQRWWGDLFEGHEKPKSPTPIRVKSRKNAE